MIPQEILLEIITWTLNRSKSLESINGVDCRIEKDSVYVALRNGDVSGYWHYFPLTNSQTKQEIEDQNNA